jgi:lipopolysaccharide/colanic/teichoic acid biosynthesis glycosyltransferase
MFKVLQETMSYSTPGAKEFPECASNVTYRFIKRSLDIVIALIALTLTSPLLLLAMVAVALSSRGSIFYRAKRAGLYGEPFAMFKLRTMRTGTDSPDRKVTAEKDERVTPVGRWLRKLKIDELPQLWNVLRGDMAIVGPRPEDWDIVQQYYSARDRRALEVRPGIASPVDVDWYPDMTYHDPAPPGVPFQEHYLRHHLPVQVAAAVRYRERQSFLLDIKVILRLVYCVVVRSWLPPTKRLLPIEKE